VTTVTVRAPAKINLGLRVGRSRRADGYHPLATVYQAIGLYDEIKARPVDDGGISVTVTGEGDDVVPLDSTNLAVQAATLLAKRFEVGTGVALSIHKSIAVAGGLGGGSADAAGALVACDALWGTDATRGDLVALASELGSDVPFCLVGGLAVGTGRGEQLSPVLAKGTYEWVLAYADTGLSTPQVYAEFDRLTVTAPPGRPGVQAAPEVPEQLMTALRSGDPYAVGMALHNDLEGAALRLRPALRHTLALGVEMNALGSILCGSGPTCLFLASDPDHAVDIAVALAGSGTCRLVQRAAGPVHGARVVT
jgi:4-diphosphocytidyl-2-C-methyl-D-erythritol kinase